MIENRFRMLSTGLKRAAAGVLFVGAGALLPTMSSAEPIVLRMATAVPDGNPLVTQVFAPWAESVNEAGKGVLQIELVNGLAIANTVNMWERVEQGVVDLGQSLPGSFGVPFPKTGVASLPLLYDDTVKASAALWGLYEDGVISDEYDKYPGIRLLALYTLPMQGLSASKPIQSREDMKGLKVRAVDKVAANIVTELGGAPIEVPGPEIYQAISRGVVDAALANWLMIGTFRVGEVAPHHQRGIPLGAPTGFIVMNAASYEALPPEAKQILDTVSGETASRFLATAFDNLSKGIEASVAAGSGQHIYDLSEENLTDWTNHLQPVIEAWVNATPDGQRVLDAFKEKLAKVSAE
jgi:TRAP-type C4-dicarboxylate transport system substrate-binding protein